MRNHTSLGRRSPRSRANLYALIAACGGNDLTFPGNIPATPTSQFTATPEPEET